jgi:hypothetical protein
MYVVDLPPFSYRIQSRGKAYYIFDIIRKRYVRLTPEEWTRQHLVHYLIDHLGYPKALISLERSISYSGLKHRPDMVIYAKTGKPLVLVECKAPHIKLSEHVYHQLARYNMALQAKILVVTNGKVYRCWQRQGSTSEHKLLEAIPTFDALA